jgi:hypothetical protein
MLWGSVAVYNWPKNNERFRKVERFVQRMFANWDKLLQPPFHPKWKDINLAATVEGWTRFATAEQELQRLYGSNMPAQNDIKREFQAFLNGSPAGGASLSDSDREALFRQFPQWREKQGHGGRAR